MTPEPRPGRLVGGRYRLVERLGSGGFGRVWKARDETLHVDVALKEVSPYRPVSDREWADMLARAQREARNAVQLRDHPNIVAVYDIVIEDEVPWTVMRLVTGTSLQDRLADRPLPVAEVVDVARSLLNALTAAHAIGIVHRDVKPANVMMAATGEVLLIDFGIAVHEDDTRTVSGLIIGSPGYMAPERVLGERGQAASDLFSLGATLYHAVEGDSPFHRDTPEESAAAVLHHQPSSPRCETGLALLIMRLLEKDPARRPTIPQALALIDTSLESEEGPWVGEDADRVRRLLGKAEGIARRVIDPTERARPLAHLAAALVRIDPDRAEQIAAEAEQIARDESNSSRRVTVLADVAAGLATTDPRRAEALVELAEQTARDIGGKKKRMSALAHVAAALASFDPDRAEQIAREAGQAARRLSGVYLRASALTRVATALATTDPRRAEQIATELEQSSHGQYMSIELADVAAVLATINPYRAKQIAAEAEHVARRRFNLGPLALPRVAAALAAIDPDKAKQIATEAAVASRPMKFDSEILKYLKLRTLTAAATALAVIDPRSAEDVAAEAEQAARDCPRWMRGEALANVAITLTDLATHDAPSDQSLTEDR